MARWDPAHVTPRKKLYIHTKIGGSNGFSGQIPYLAISHYHGNHFPKFLAHVLSWVKNYHHAKFQRNPSTGLARMMVQTDIQISPFISIYLSIYLSIYIYIYFFFFFFFFFFSLSEGR